MMKLLYFGTVFYILSAPFQAVAMSLENESQRFSRSKSPTLSEDLQVSLAELCQITDNLGNKVVNPSLDNSPKAPPRRKKKPSVDVAPVHEEVKVNVKKTPPPRPAPPDLSKRDEKNRKISTGSSEESKSHQKNNISKLVDLALKSEGGKEYFSNIIKPASLYGSESNIAQTTPQTKPLQHATSWPLLPREETKKSTLGEKLSSPSCSLEEIDEVRKVSSQKSSEPTRPTPTINKASSTFGSNGHMSSLEKLSAATTSDHQERSNPGVTAELSSGTDSRSRSSSVSSTASKDSVASLNNNNGRLSPKLSMDPKTSQVVKSRPKTPVKTKSSKITSWTMSEAIKGSESEKAKIIPGKIKGKFPGLMNKLANAFNTISSASFASLPMQNGASKNRLPLPDCHPCAGGDPENNGEIYSVEGDSSVTQKGVFLDSRLRGNDKVDTNSVASLLTTLENKEQTRQPLSLPTFPSTNNTDDFPPSSQPVLTNGAAVPPPPPLPPMGAIKTDWRTKKATEVSQPTEPSVTVSSAKKIDIKTQGLQMLAFDPATVTLRKTPLKPIAPVVAVPTQGTPEAPTLKPQPLSPKPAAITTVKQSTTASIPARKQPLIDRRKKTEVAVLQAGSQLLPPPPPSRDGSKWPVIPPQPTVSTEKKGSPAVKPKPPAVKPKPAKK